MKCPRCSGFLLYQYGRWFGEANSLHCLNCGHYIWEPPRVYMPQPKPTVQDIANRLKMAEVAGAKKLTIKERIEIRYQKLQAEMQKLEMQLDGGA